MPMTGSVHEAFSEAGYWGPVDFDLVKGRAMFIYWSWDGDRNWPRFERLFKSIQ